MIIEKTDTHFVIKEGYTGALHRRFAENATDNELTSNEETIAKLCKHILNGKDYAEI